MTYRIKYNRTTYHIDGIATATKGSQLDYSITACPALTRNGHRMATGRTYGDLKWALEDASTSARNRGAKVCEKCRVAAETLLTVEA